jgi:hypothetical protein
MRLAMTVLMKQSHHEDFHLLESGRWRQLPGYEQLKSITKTLATLPWDGRIPKAFGTRSGSGCP